MGPRNQKVEVMSISFGIYYFLCVILSTAIGILADKHPAAGIAAGVGTFLFLFIIGRAAQEENI